MICFDDLERKASSLTIKEILGVISSLSEEKDCKIVIIFNEEKIDEDTEGQFKKFREKVVDMEILYKPEIRDNLEVAKKIFSNKKP